MRRIDIAGRHGEHGKGIPAEDALARGQIALAPFGIVTAWRQIAERGADIGRQAGRAPFGNSDLAAGVGDRRDRLGQDDGGIGQQSAKIAGMMVAVPQIDHQIDRHAAARPHEHGRRVDRQTRAVRGDQHIGRQPFPVGREEFA